MFIQDKWDLQHTCISGRTDKTDCSAWGVHVTGGISLKAYCKEKPIKCKKNRHVRAVCHNFQQAWWTEVCSQALRLRYSTHTAKINWVNPAKTHRATAPGFNLMSKERNSSRMSKPEQGRGQQLRVISIIVQINLHVLINNARSPLPVTYTILFRVSCKAIFFSQLGRQPEKATGALHER